jgi:Zn/Cd-binding protein ZinT
MSGILTLEAGARIETLTLAAANARISLNADATVSTLNAEAPGARIETQTGAHIGTANLGAATEITGTGDITTANIKADGVVIEAKPATITVAENVTASVGGTTVGSTATESPVAAGGGGGGGGDTSLITAALAGDGTFDADGVNYALLSVTTGDYASGAYSVNDAAATPSKVLADGSLIKLPIPDGVREAEINITQNGRTVLTANLEFDEAGAAAPDTLYGTVPMTFSAFFHDITANIDAIEPTDTAFAANGSVAVPIKFITQGTRAKADGLSSLTYAEGDRLDKVDVISSATYGDSAHFVPNGNLTLDGSDRTQKTNPNAAVTGIAKVEVGVSFDLYANALLLEAAGRATAQSENILKIMDDFEVSESRIYKPKYLFPDGSFGKRAETALNENAVKPLPGTEVDTDDVTYGGNWGDKVTGVTFGVLELEYAGGSYWDNFAEYLYGGYIEDSEGNREPLVFLQNIFSHRGHTDFDIAVSPSRFARFSNLKTPDTYTVHVYAYGFEDIEAEFYMKDYVNGGLAIDTASYQTAPNGPDKDIFITGIDEFDAYDPAAFALTKGGAAVSSGNYAVVKETDGKLKLTLKSALFQGAFQGAYTVNILPDTDTVASKALSFTLVKTIDRPQLTLNSDRGSDGVNADETNPIEVKKTDGKLYFTNDEFASALITSGRSGYTSIKEYGSNAAATAIGAAAARENGAGPYYLDLSAAAFAAGKTYVITANATGFVAQTYYVKVAPRELADWAGTWNAFTNYLDAAAVTKVFTEAYEELTTAQKVAIGQIAGAPINSAVALKAVFASIIDANVSAAAISGNTLTLYTGGAFDSNGTISGNATSQTIATAYVWDGDIPDEESGTVSKFHTEDANAGVWKYLLLYSTPEKDSEDTALHFHLRHGSADDLTDNSVHGVNSGVLAASATTEAEALATVQGALAETLAYIDALLAGGGE